ncbi:carbamoyltransferase HypF [Desulfotomaculum defluvii]
MHQLQRYKIRVSGIVQGVGFRPFVYRLATKYGLSGTVNNDKIGVVIEVEGELKEIDRFLNDLKMNPPFLARIENITKETLAPRYDHEFIINKSQTGKTEKLMVPPDMATCKDCMHEILNPDDRHYRYAFTNCTNCGPRFTILFKQPYDRKVTSMKVFPMCYHCSKEYANPLDRRFHAQPVACPNCGPQMKLVDSFGNAVEGDWLEVSCELLRLGNILAIKGLGGFHLACNAQNEKAIRELRLRKNRPAKPFAVMCRDLETIKKYCYVSEQEAKILTSPSAPIVLLRKKDKVLPYSLAPGLTNLGCMLPYTPLHYLLLQNGPALLVMTSGNSSNLPQVIDNQFAFEELIDIADFFLFHDREILNRCDDSVIQVVNKKIQFIRRSRGYVPSPINLSMNTKRTVLAMGGEKKNTFCLLHQGKAYLSPHIGDISTLEGMENLKIAIKKYCDLLDVKPQVVAIDIHPNYHSSSIGKDIVRDMGLDQYIKIQHHHAHLASCLAENNINEEVIGIILDGTGYGADGHLWGFEVLRGSYLDFNREYYLDYVPLPGGEQAISNPWLTASAYLITFLGEKGAKIAMGLFPNYQVEIEMAKQMLDKGFNVPLSSSCGRIFDAVAALTGVCYKNTYEGEAAVRLGNMMSKETYYDLESYPYYNHGKVIDPTLVLEQVIRDVTAKVPRRVIVRRFHHTIIDIVINSALKVREQAGLSTVALSGGSWQNHYLLTLTYQLLQERGFKVLTQNQVPPNDGGISLGQAIIASLGKQIR